MVKSTNKKAASSSSKSSPSGKSAETVSKKHTLTSLQNLQDVSKKKHAKADATTKKYSEYVARGRKWLQSYFKRPETVPDNPNATDWESNVDMQPQLPGFRPELSDDIQDLAGFQRAFDDIPNVHSPKALALFLSFKIFHENLGEGTSNGIYSAFKLLWKNSAADRYRGKWHYNENAKEWRGNPADSAEVQDVKDAIKHKCGAEGGDRKHSLAMSKEHMEKMFTWSLEQFPEIVQSEPQNLKDEAFRVKHVQFRAFASSAWTIWSRNFELIKLKRKDLTLGLQDSNIYGKEYFELHLVDRKGWQKQIDKARKEDNLRSNRFKIYDQPELPACDAKHWLLEWINYLETRIYCHSLGPEDYIFPAISANGIVQRGEHITHDTIQKWINEFTNSAKIPQATGGSFSTHCFRRGGAQYRFMFAPVGSRWSLRMVRWWGGWAEGEHRDTLIKYLLDELHSYEQDYSDALCPVRLEAESSLMGEHRMVANASSEEMRMMHTSLTSELNGLKDIVLKLTTLNSSGPNIPWTDVHANKAQYQPLATTHTRPLVPISISPHSLQVNTNSHVPSTTLGSTTINHVFLHPSQQVSQTNEQEIAQVPTRRRLVIPDIPLRKPDGTMSPRSNSWREIVEHWLHPDVPRGLDTALKDWPSEWLTENRELLAQKYHHRRIIATEFLVEYGGDEEKFLEAYPDAHKGHSKLRIAIDRVREIRGTKVPRKKRSQVQVI